MPRILIQVYETIFGDITQCSPLKFNSSLVGMSLPSSGYKNNSSKKPAWKQVASKGVGFPLGSHWGEHNIVRPCVQASCYEHIQTDSSSSPYSFALLTTAFDRSKWWVSCPDPWISGTHLILVYVTWRTGLNTCFSLGKLISVVQTTVSHFNIIRNYKKLWWQELISCFPLIRHSVKNDTSKNSLLPRERLYRIVI